MKATKDIDHRRLNIAFFVAGLFVGLAWIVFAFSVYFRSEFGLPGIQPGNVSAWYGIFLSPFLHGDLSHIFSNTLPAFLLITLLIYSHRGIAFMVGGLIILITGILVWFIGENGSNHIGASGLIYGLSAFLFFSGIIRWDKQLLFISATILFLYGSMIWGVLPLQPGVSWEGHLSGAISGTALAFLLRNKGPQRIVEEELSEDDKMNPDDFEIFIRAHVRETSSPADPHYHQNPHQQKKYTHNGTHKRIT